MSYFRVKPVPKAQVHTWTQKCIIGWELAQHSKDMEHMIKTTLANNMGHHSQWLTP